MNLPKEILILSSKQWTMTNDNGEQRKGTTIWYVPADMKQVIGPDGVCGYVPSKSTMPYEFHNSVVNNGGAPLLAEPEFSLRSRNNGTELVLAGATFIGKK